MSLSDLIRQIVRPLIPVRTIEAKVSSVDKETGTINVIPVGGNAPVYNVRLKSVVDKKKLGILVFPKEGSIVLIDAIWNNINNCFVSKVNEIESCLIVVEGLFKCEITTKGDLIFNDGENKGLVKLPELVKKINALEKDMNTIKSIFAAWVPVPNDGGAVLKGATATWSGSQLSITVEKDLENEKIKH